MCRRSSMALFVSATSDGRLMQVWMFLIMLLETLHSVFCIHMCYYFLIYNRSNNDSTAARVWSQNTLGIFTGLIILLCQSFISRCIYSLWSKYGSLVIVATLLLSVGQFVAATSVTILLYLGPGNDSTSLIRALNCVHSGLVVAANLVLTSALCYRLLTRRTGHYKTGSLIREITRYTSQGGEPFVNQ
ncbi:hypothetical protein LXA43DRAFT_543251 [Ganoderma leucocontextum]|nr:hypothetical protein LXA43DRAFT_543251 [Ganoderma leucocontextum]